MRHPILPSGTPWFSGLWLAAVLAVAAAHPVCAQSTLTGTVVGDGQRPIGGATVAVRRADGSLQREATTDAAGHFRLTSLPAGTYAVTTRRVGFRSAELPVVRLAEGQTLHLAVVLSQAPTQLSTISVAVSPTSVDATATEIPMRIARSESSLLPTGRSAAGLVALLPGGRADQLWGGVPGSSNNYQVDGIPMNHPGLGGDFLSLSVDWVETLDVRGLGAGAEHGDFQGGVINAVTRTGTNARTAALRSNYESPRLTASNFNIGEQGAEQAGRREVAGEALGPLVRDRLFYFLAGQYVSRDVRSPELATSAPRDFQAFHERQTDARALGKLTWLPTAGQRVELLAGRFGFDIQRAGINGVDAMSALARVTRPTSFYAASWSGAPGARDRLELRLAGFDAREVRAGYEGVRVPAVHVMAAGRQPLLQNAEFTEIRAPRTVSATATWRAQRRLVTDHDLLVGAAFSRGTWQDERLRNGGLTWRPYPTTGSTTPFDPADVTSWESVASVWGGELHLRAGVGSNAIFVQDRLALGTRLTLSPGIRLGSWKGNITPFCGTPAVLPGCRSFEAVRAAAWDPRIGIAWDVTGRGILAARAHWGRYHQGMQSLYFDRVQGANVYSNERLYYRAPTLTSSRQSFTTAQRNDPATGFSTDFSESRLDISGRVDNYRQPFVDQGILALERSFGDAWKAEVVYARRRSGDVVGLRDLNLASNYARIRDVHVEHRYVRGRVLDPAGDRLVLPEAYVPGYALRELLLALWARRQFPATLFGYDTADVLRMTWRPDVVLTTIPEARRAYDQLGVVVRTVRSAWRAEGSVTAARLTGNVPGATGHGTTATRFSAGPFVNPNEGINGSGYLPNSSELEAKGWIVGRLPFGLEGGLVYTHVLGERFAPTFQLTGEYAFLDAAGDELPASMFANSLGQTILVEPRGARHYASRALLDAHLEWAPRTRRWVVTADVFNVFAENAVIGVKTAIDFHSPTEPDTWFGAPRLRVGPRTLRVGIRFD